MDFPPFRSARATRFASPETGLAARAARPGCVRRTKRGPRREAAEAASVLLVRAARCGALRPPRQAKRSRAPLRPGVRAPAVFGSWIVRAVLFSTRRGVCALDAVCVKPGPPRAVGRDCYSATSSSRLRVLVGSTLMPGPIVVAMVIDLMYLPLADDGLARRISSSTAA